MLYFHLLPRDIKVQLLMYTENKYTVKCKDIDKKIEMIVECLGNYWRVLCFILKNGRPLFGLVIFLIYPLLLFHLLYTSISKKYYGVKAKQQWSLIAKVKSDRVFDGIL